MALENYLDTLNVKVTWKDLATQIGMDPSNFTHAKKGKDIGFLYLLKISQLLAGDSFDSILKDWCLKLNQPINIKYALEYLTINRFDTELEQLLDKISNKSNSKELNDWADAYRIFLLYLREDEMSIVMSELKKYNPKNFETKILADIIDIHCKQVDGEYKAMCNLIENLLPSIELIENDYIKTCYKTRLMELLSHVKLYYFNDPTTARSIAKEIIFSKIGPKFSANSYYIVGMSYLYEDYELCMSNLLEYRKLCKKIGNISRVRTIDDKDIPFVNSIWGKHNVCPVTNDISELAHYEAKYGDKEKALEMIEKSLKSDKLSGYKLYYKALATNDLTTFMESIIYFVTKSGNKFGAMLPYEHLKGDPAYKKMADMLLDA